MKLVDPQNGNLPVELLDATGPDPKSNDAETHGVLSSSKGIVTRQTLRPRPQLEKNRFVIISAGAILLAILIFVIGSVPRAPVRDSKGLKPTSSSDQSSEKTAAPSEKSLFPIIESQKISASQTSKDGFLNEGDLERTARSKPSPSLPPVPPDTANSLAGIPPFGTQDNWQPPPYQPTRQAIPSAGADTRVTEHEVEKASLIYVRAAPSRPGSESNGKSYLESTGPGLALPVGTRLRARLESAVSSAVRAPVMAVIEYNYERDGEIVVPAGTKAVGYLQDADRSGYVRLQFDSMLMPDGANVPIQAVATDLQMKPIRGKVEGKHTGKNVLVRSLAGIGQAGAMLVGRGNLDQPLSESDLLRERVSNNIGQASDEQISRMAIAQRVVITIPADTLINVVFEEGTGKNLSKPTVSPEQHSSDAPSVEELRQLIQLRKELNQPDINER